MMQALAEARRAAELGEVPIGAVVVRDGEVVGRGHNRRELDGDPLLDIHNTSRVAAVVTNGWLFDSAGRQKLFDDVLATAVQP